MAKYTITYKCGHTAVVQLYGKEAERQRKIAWYATIDCPECEAREQKEKAESAGLPQLTGSDKQIAWATQIRNRAIEIIETKIKEITLRRPKLTAEDEQRISQIKSAMGQWIDKETTAKYWIDNRSDITNLRLGSMTLSAGTWYSVAKLMCNTIKQE